MDIYMIWATDGYAPSPGYWLVEAWDDDTVSENNEGWQEAVDKAYADHGPKNVRITKATVDFDKVLAAFTPVDIS